MTLGMVFNFLLQIFLFQILIFGIIVFVLYKLLNRNLIEGAVHQFEVMASRHLDPDLKKVTVICYKNVSEKNINRILRAAEKNLARKIEIEIEMNKRLKGGLIIRVKDVELNFSLMNRLRESGLMR